MRTSLTSRWVGAGAWLVAAAVAFAPGLAGAKPKYAPPPPPPPPPPWFQYSVPFTCGTNADGSERAVPGEYAVAVNVMNTSGGWVQLRKQVRLTYPPGAENAGAVSDVVKEHLAPDRAMQVSCDEVLNEFAFASPLPAFVQGFLVIRTNAYLDVSVSHTAAGPNGDVSQDVEVVVGRPIGNRDYVQDGESGGVVICHRPPGNPGNAHTIEVGPSAWPAHSAHGDSKGGCPPKHDD